MHKWLIAFAVLTAIVVLSWVSLKSVYGSAQRGIIQLQGQMLAAKYASQQYTQSGVASGQSVAISPGTIYTGGSGGASGGSNSHSVATDNSGNLVYNDGYR